MKIHYSLFCGALLSIAMSCADKKPTEVQLASEIHLSEPDTASENLPNTLPEGSGPYRAYSFIYNEIRFTVAADSLTPPGADWFDGPSYGLVSEGKELLPTEFDKIGSPGVLAANCVEVVKGDQCWLYNLQTDSLLITAFDMLLPSFNDSSNTFVIAKRGTFWYELNVSNFRLDALHDFSLTQYLRLHNFGTESFDVNNSITPVELGNGHYWQEFIITPHYLSLLDLFPSKCTYTSISPQIETIASASLGRRIISMIVGVYDQSLNIRRKSLERIDLKVYDNEKLVANEVISGTVALGAHNNYRFINDSLVEARILMAKDDIRDYTPKSAYQYFSINRNGEVTEASSNRFFGYTEFAEIDSTYFMGNFRIPMSTAEREEQKVQNLNRHQHGTGFWNTKHLSLEDLDLMQNEILASYGLRFTNTKWQEYFEAQKWYDAQFDNVDHLLGKRDKHNIQEILQARKRLMEHGADIIDKTDEVWISVP